MPSPPPDELPRLRPTPALAADAVPVRVSVADETFEDELEAARAAAEDTRPIAPLSVHTFETPRTRDERAAYAHAVDAEDTLSRALLDADAAERASAAAPPPQTEPRLADTPAPSPAEAAWDAVKAAEREALAALLMYGHLRARDLRVQATEPSGMPAVEPPASARDGKSRGSESREGEGREGEGRDPEAHAR